MRREVVRSDEPGPDLAFVVQGVRRGGKAVPIQVSWEGPTERHRRALDAFHAVHPHAAEPVFITRESFEAGLDGPLGP